MCCRAPLIYEYLAIWACILPESLFISRSYLVRLFWNVRAKKYVIKLANYAPSLNPLKNLFSHFLIRYPIPSPPPFLLSLEDNFGYWKVRCLDSKTAQFNCNARIEGELNCKQTRFFLKKNLLDYYYRLNMISFAKLLISIRDFKKNQNNKWFYIKF